MPDFEIVERKDRSYFSGWVMPTEIVFPLDPSVVTPTYSNIGSCSNTIEPVTYYYANYIYDETMT